MLDHYVARGMGELSTDKLPQLIELKYHTLQDAAREIGPAARIREVFVGSRSICTEVLKVQGDT